MHRSLEIDHSRRGVPFLESGDHLDQPTFHRSYQDAPTGFRAELVEGAVIVPSPARRDHSSIASLLNGWLLMYRLATPGVDSLDNCTVLLPPDSEPQPDGAMIVLPEYGGQTRLESDYVVGAPELALEVASSTVSYDLHSKLGMYESNGVREYVVAVLRDEEIRWFAAESGRFAPLTPDEDGIFRSRVFPGLWLNAGSIWIDDREQFLQTVQRGLASPEHATFGERLRAQRV